MNRRIRKKKEKQSIWEYSCEIAPDVPNKKRRRTVSKTWYSYTYNGFKIKIGYKRNTE